ncbi:hypothetical protein PANTOEA_20665 [Pantoea dispersa]|uniref:hypothetical protein n=1 Tax=Pantoea dispersa TaxID=59814 RepID=UPI0032B330B9
MRTRTAQQQHAPTVAAQFIALSTTVRLAGSRDKSRRYGTCGLETGHLNDAAISPLQPVRLNNLPPGRHSTDTLHQP